MISKNKKACQEKLISVQPLVHIISMFNDLWMPTEAIEAHICKLLMDLQKLKLDKIMSNCQKNNMFMVSVHLVLDALGEVAKYLKG